MLLDYFPLSTHRVVDGEDGVTAYFPYETAIAAISICFFRWTVKSSWEPMALTIFFSALLTCLTIWKKTSYELILAVEVFSYAVPFLLFAKQPLPFLRGQPTEHQQDDKEQSTMTWKRKISKYLSPLIPSSLSFGSSSRQKELMIRLVLIAFSAVLSLLASYIVAHGYLVPAKSSSTSVLMKSLYPLLNWLVPIAEFSAAYDSMTVFSSSAGALHQQVSHLLFVTFHIQVGMGFLGIDFLRREQDRRNQLVRMDMLGRTDQEIRQETTEQTSATTFSPSDDSSATKHALINGNTSTSSTPSPTASSSSPSLLLQRAKNFQRTAAPFILFSALPYMLQIITFGNINTFAFTCLQDDLHRMVRLHHLFDHDTHLAALAQRTTSSESVVSAIAPEGYANAMSDVVSVAYQMANRKLFSLPKIMLLPTVMSRQPLLVVQVFPFIFLSDYLKATVVSYMTTKIENLQKEITEIAATRNKVESFDIKNAELLRRSGKGATKFTQRRWQELTVQVQDRKATMEIISRSKGFFSFIQRNFVFSVLIDCALANLIAVGKIASADTFVFSRAIEDAVDMLLMRSRSEAELARMMTDIEKLRNLASLWQDARNERSLLPCNLLVTPSVTSLSATSAATSTSLNDSDMQKASSLSKRMIFRNLQYNRGTAHVRIDHMELPSGIYALTGSNGSGKSTLFRIIMSCSCNEKSIDLPPSINLLTPFEPLTEIDDVFRAMACDKGEENATNRGDDEDDCDASTDSTAEATISVDGESVSSLTSALSRTSVNNPQFKPRLSITMPSSNVVEISQSFYWPLHSRPIDWIYHDHVLETCTPVELDIRARKLALELHELQFFQSSFSLNDDNDDEGAVVDREERTIKRIMKELIEEKEDWFSDLSGGQKSKVELVRKIFMHDVCPDVLLIDETMAPLDPASKSLVMAKLKKFCSQSIVIVIYHTDVGHQGKEFEGHAVDCVPANEFFDKNIHLEKGVVRVRNTC